MKVEEPFFISVEKNQVDALLYQTMFNEVERLETCFNRKERTEIRKYIKEIHSKIVESLNQDSQ